MSSSPSDLLKADIGKLKSATASSPVSFALITGKGDGVLLLGPNANPKNIDDAKKETGGSPIKGKAFKGKDGYVFECASPSPALGTAIRNCLSKHAGLSAPVEVCAPGEHESETEEPQETTHAPEPHADPRIAKIDAHVKDLNARLAKTDPKASSAQGAKLKLSEAAVAYRKGNFDQTEKLLKEADTLLTFLEQKK